MRELDQENVGQHYRRHRMIQTFFGIALILLGGCFLLFSDASYPKQIAAWALIALGGFFVNEQVTRHWLGIVAGLLPFRRKEP